MRSSASRRRSSSSKNTHERSGDAVIDCSTFHNCEVDALYSEGAERELDDEAMLALTEHAKTCEACTARLDRLRDQRRLVLSVAVESVPSDFEARIMAAVDAALAKRPVVAAAAPVAKASGGATILRFMARPSFAVAATFVLVLSGAAFVMTRSASAPATMGAFAKSDEATPAVAASAASPSSPAPVAAPDEQTVAMATATAAAPPPAAVAAAGPSPAFAKAGKAAATRAADPALDAAKALAAAGRCSEALPKLEALSASTPEADLYAARCIAKTRGCAAAEPRFDRAAQTNAGTEIGSRAQLEGAKCYQSTGDVVAARKRYEAAKDEGMLAAEATTALEDLDSNAKPAAKPGTPSAGAHASPKAMPAPRNVDLK
jgi:hypothetical protein